MENALDEPLRPITDKQRASMRAAIESAQKDEDDGWLLKGMLLGERRTG